MLDSFTVIGDPHVTKKSKEKAIRLFQIIEAMGRNCVWLGDLLDTKELISGLCQNLFFDYFKSSKLQHIIIVGNHDYFNLDCLDHSLKTLSALPNVMIIDSVRQHPKLPFVFFPYIHDKAKLKEELLKYSGQNLIAFGHFEVSGFDFGTGAICEDKSISYDDFQGFKRVISGHFHKLQQTGNFTYLGSPFSHSFGEANQDKILGHYTVSTDTLELIPTGLPRHVSQKIDMSKAGAEKKLEKFILENQDNLIRIQLMGSTQDVIKLDKSKYVNLSIKWEDKSIDPLMPSVTLDESMDNVNQFRQWATDIKKLDVETIKLGLSILEAVGAK